MKHCKTYHKDFKSRIIRKKSIAVRPLKRIIRHRQTEGAGEKDFLICINMQGQIIYANEYVTKKLEKEILCEDLKDVLAQTDWAKIDYSMEQMLSLDESHIIPLQFKTNDSQYIHTLCKISVGSKKYGNKKYIRIAGMDLSKTNITLLETEYMNSLYKEIASSEEETQRKFEELLIKQNELEKTQKRYSLVVETASMGIWDWDIEYNHFIYSRKWKEIIGTNKSSKEIGNWTNYIHAEDKPIVEKQINEHVTSHTGFYEVECRIKTALNTYKWVHIIGKASYDEMGLATRVTGSMTDISEKKLHEEKMKHIAYFDELTNIPNRHFLKKTTNQLCHKETKMAMIYLDIDNFKYVNESFGHDYGDWVIIQISKILKDMVNEKVFIAKMNGDEFVILLIGEDDKDEIAQFIKKMRNKLKKPFSKGDIKFSLTFSMGVAMYPQDGENFDEILMNADTARNKSKEEGTNRYTFFDKKFKDLLLEKMRIESKLRTGIKNKEFVLYYQPQLDIKNNKIKGFEALIRWIQEDGTIIPPSDFIPVAEETGLIIPIGKWVIEEVCEFIKRLSRLGYDDFYVAANVSVVQLNQEEFIDEVERIVKASKINPKRLHLEITETILMESIEMHLDKFMKLKDLGVSLSLDDFGKGYSSLTYLKKLPINILKVEKAFIDDISENKNMTASIINLGHSLNLEVVAEGVESENQFDYLRENNCDIIQGYLISKPIPEKDIFSVIQKYS
jgi:diguanylate cyclase (GGDEF)-like protein/PAS domain S-box-containing protein